MGIMLYTCLALIISLQISLFTGSRTSSAEGVSAERISSEGVLEEATSSEITLLYGYVIDHQSGEPLSGTNVNLRDSEYGTSSNTFGYYQLFLIKSGTHTLQVSYLSYVNHELEISIGEGEKKRLDINLNQTGYELDEVTITSQREKEEQNNIGRRSISTNQIGDATGVLQDDVFRFIQLKPGIAAASDYSSGLHIRGGSPDQTLIQLDNATIYNPTHFFGFFSTFNPDAIRDVQLHMGTYPAKYGGRLGSVIRINSKDGHRERHGGSLSFGMLSSRAMVEGPFHNGSGSYMAAFRRSTLEPVLNLLRNEVQGVPDKFSFYDINTSLNYKISDQNRLSASFYSGSDYMALPFLEHSYFNFRYGNRMFSTSWTHIANSNLIASVQLAGSHYYNAPTLDHGGTPYERKNQIDELTVKANLVWFPASNHEMSAGIQGGRITHFLSDSFDGLLTNEFRSQSWETILYVQNEWRPADSWRINVGVRGVHFSRGDILRMSPRFSADYFLTQNLRFQAGYGRYYQFLVLDSNQSHPGFDVWYMVDSSMSPSFSDQFSLGMKFLLGDTWGVELEGYYRTMNDLFQPDPLLGNIAGFDYYDLFRFGDGYAYGVEALLERKSELISGFIGYTFGRTWRRFPGINQDRYFPPHFDRTHDLTAVLNVTLSEKWRLSSTFTYKSGQAYTKPLGRTVFSNNPIKGSQVNHLIIGRVNASRMPDYHRVDLSAIRQGTFFGIAESELKLEVINLYSRRNVWFYQYDFDKNPPVMQEMPLLPILPSISYTLKF